MQPKLHISISYIDRSGLRNPVLTNLIGKDGGARLIDIIEHLPHKLFLL